MTNEFGHDFLRKMQERQAIEKELETIANMQQKNAKYNIYVTKAYALRNEITMKTIQKRELEKGAVQHGLSLGTQAVFFCQAISCEVFRDALMGSK